MPLCQYHQKYKERCGSLRKLIGKISKLISHLPIGNICCRTLTLRHQFTISLALSRPAASAVFRDESFPRECVATFGLMTNASLQYRLSVMLPGHMNFERKSWNVNEFWPRRLFHTGSHWENAYCHCRGRRNSCGNTTRNFWIGRPRRAQFHLLRTRRAHGWLTQLERQPCLQLNSKENHCCQLHLESLTRSICMRTKRTCLTSTTEHSLTWLRPILRPALSKLSSALGYCWKSWASWNSTNPSIVVVAPSIQY